VTAQVQEDWTPRPDPTLLTTQQLLRELASLREILETRLDAMDQAARVLEQTVNRTPTLLQSAITGVREVYDERFTSMQRQFAERDIRTEQTATARDAALAAALQAAKEAVAEQVAVAARATDKAEESFNVTINGLRDIYDERFQSVAKQFTERDVRTDQAATASASALAAALQAAKEAVFEQAQAAAKAAEKTELSFTKQIDQIQLQIKTIGDGFSDRIAELKERIDRGEGSDSGSARQRNETRLNTGTVVSLGLLALSVVTFIILYVVKK
jgi:hypothetical protein